MAISKKIHYCWFGKNKKSKLIECCIDSWKKNLHDYEIVEWNEDNFNINCNRYVKEAYAAKKWAFVSDYVRLYALYTEGGVYLDTDVEVFKSFDRFLTHGFFSGFEKYFDTLSPITAVMGTEKGSTLLQRLLNEYENISFINKDGTCNTKTNTKRLSEFFIFEYGIDAERDEYQILRDNIHIYPSNYFCVKSEESYSVHHFDGSWMPFKDRMKVRINKSNHMPKIIKKFYNFIYWRFLC